MNLTPQEIKYCVVCDNIITLESSENEMVVCSEECRVTFADFEVLYSFKECTHCRQPVTNDRTDKSNFCSEDCSQTHEYIESSKNHYCINCDVKIQEPIVSKVCGELCKTQIAMERYLDVHEEYIESKRQEEVDEDRDF